jgi:hypothetical protein
MRTSPFASRLIVLAILATWFCPGPRAEAREQSTGSRSPSAVSAPASSPGGQPATPGEVARFAERERQDGSLATFEAGARISTTTIIIILLLVIILLILL